MNNKVIKIHVLCIELVKFWVVLYHVDESIDVGIYSVLMVQDLSKQQKLHQKNKQQQQTNK